MQHLQINWGWARRALFLVGFAGVLSGIGVAAYSAFLLRPRVAALTEELGGSIHDLDQAVSLVDKDGRLASLIPETLTRLEGVLLKGSAASSATGQTAKESKEGLRGLVTPKKQLSRTNAALQGTAREMRLLAASIDKMAVISRELAQAGEPLATARRRLQGLDQAVGYAALPTQAMMLGLGVSGLLFLSGLVSLILGLALEPTALSAAGTAAAPRLNAA